MLENLRSSLVAAPHQGPKLLHLTARATIQFATALHSTQALGARWRFCALLSTDYEATLRATEHHERRQLLSW